MHHHPSSLVFPSSAWVDNFLTESAWTFFWFKCTFCGTKTTIFGSNGPFVGSIPVVEYGGETCNIPSVFHSVVRLTNKQHERGSSAVSNNEAEKDPKNINNNDPKDRSSCSTPLLC